MAYFIEFGLIRGEDFYQEFVLFDVNNRDNLVPADSVEHMWMLYGTRSDYGIIGQFGQNVASSSNGLITTPQPGVIAVSIPSANVFGTTDPDTGVWSGSIDTIRTSLRFKLLAQSTVTGRTTTLITGTMSYGDRLMPNPRIQLGVYPSYPAAPIPVVQASQIKQQLALVPTNYDLVEAALLGPTDPATIVWETGGPVSLGSPLSNVISGALGYNSVAMGIFLAAAAANPL